MKNAKDLVGICRSCKEWTSVHEACCGALVYVEGNWYDPSEYCERCGEEMHDSEYDDLACKESQRSEQRGKG